MTGFTSYVWDSMQSPLHFNFGTALRQKAN